MKTLKNKPYRGFRRLVDRYIDTVIYFTHPGVDRCSDGFCGPYRA